MARRRQRLALLILGCLAAWPPVSGAEPYPLTDLDRKYLDHAKQVEDFFDRKGLYAVNAPIDARLQRILERLTAGRETDEHVRLQVKLFRSGEETAFALGNGSIYVSFGLIARMENETQLAAVIGHEAAHVLLRHSLQGYQKEHNTTLLFDITGLFFGLPSELNLLYYLALAGYSRDQEEAADRLTLELLRRANYDPAGLGQSLRRLDLNDEPEEHKGPPQLFKDHPSTVNRLDYLSRALAETPLPVEPGQAETDRAVYYQWTLPLRHRLVRLNLEDRRFATAKQAVADWLAVFPDDPVGMTDMGVVLRDWARDSEVQAKIWKQIEARQQAEAEAAKRANWGNSSLSPQPAKAKNDDPYRNVRPPLLAEAEVWYQKALQREPNYAPAYRELGRLYVLQEKKPEARAAYGRYLETAPEARDCPKIRRILELLDRVEEEGDPSDSASAESLKQAAEDQP